MNRTCIIVTMTMIILCCLCIASCNAGKPSRRAPADGLKLDQVFGMVPEVFGSRYEEFGIMSKFSGDYPDCWPEQIVIPDDVYLMNKGKIHVYTSDLASPPFFAAFIYDGDMEALWKDLSTQVKKAGYSFHASPSEYTDEENMFNNYRERTAFLSYPSDKNRSCMLKVDYFPDYQYTFWYIWFQQ